MWGFAISFFWYVSFTDHKRYRNNPPKNFGIHFIKVPKWINFLCGRPWADNYLDIGSMVKQIGAIILAVLFIFMIASGIPPILRFFVFAIVLSLILTSNFIIVMFCEPK